MKQAPKLRASVRLFERFHAYDVSDVRKFPASLKIPERVHYVGPCTYVTYRSDKWNDGTHDYIHTIESFPRVAVGIVEEPANRLVPARICDNATLVQLQRKALGFGYRNQQNDKEVHVGARSSCWFWHPQGRALFLIRDQRKLVAIIWGGKLGWKRKGLVG